jgi:hypothetical protein
MGATALGQTPGASDPSQGEDLQLNSELHFRIRSDLWTSLDQNKETPVRLYDIGWRYRWLDKEDWKVALLANMEGFSTGRADLVVGPERVLVGSDLRDGKLGFQMAHQEPDQSGFVFNTLYESASDRPFQAARDVWFDAFFQYQFQKIENHHYFVEATSSKNRGYLNGQFLLLPGVHFESDENWNYSFTVLSAKISWQKNPTEQFQILLDPMDPHLHYHRLLPREKFYDASAGVRTRSYMNVNRLESDMRLFFEESYFENSVSLKMSDRTSLRFNVGLAFNRFLYEGKQVYLQVGHRSTMPSDMYGSYRWEFKF